MQSSLLGTRPKARPNYLVEDDPYNSDIKNVYGRWLPLWRKASLYCPDIESGLVSTLIGTG